MPPANFYPRDKVEQYEKLTDFYAKKYGRNIEISIFDDRKENLTEILDSNLSDDLKPTAYLVKGSSYKEVFDTVTYPQEDFERSVIPTYTKLVGFFVAMKQAYLNDAQQEITNNLDRIINELLEFKNPNRWSNIRELLSNLIGLGVRAEDLDLEISLQGMVNALDGALDNNKSKRFIESAKREEATVAEQSFKYALPDAKRDTIGALTVSQLLVPALEAMKILFAQVRAIDLDSSPKDLVKAFTNYALFKAELCEQGFESNVGELQNFVLEGLRADPQLNLTVYDLFKLRAVANRISDQYEDLKRKKIEYDDAYPQRKRNIEVAIQQATKYLKELIDDISKLDVYSEKKLNTSTADKKSLIEIKEATQKKLNDLYHQLDNLEREQDEMTENAVRYGEMFTLLDIMDQQYLESRFLTEVAMSEGKDEKTAAVFVEHHGHGAQEFGLILISVNPKEKLHLDELAKISNEHDHLPILINAGGELSLFGYITAEKQWKVTPLNKQNITDAWHKIPKVMREQMEKEAQQKQREEERSAQKSFEKAFEKIAFPEIGSTSVLAQENVTTYMRQIIQLKNAHTVHDSVSVPRLCEYLVRHFPLKEIPDRVNQLFANQKDRNNFNISFYNYQLENTLHIFQWQKALMIQGGMQEEIAKQLELKPARYFLSQREPESLIEKPSVKSKSNENVSTENNKYFAKIVAGPYRPSESMYVPPTEKEMAKAREQAYSAAKEAAHAVMEKKIEIFTQEICEQFILNLIGLIKTTPWPDAGVFFGTTREGVPHRIRGNVAAIYDLCLEAKKTGEWILNFQKIAYIGAMAARNKPTTFLGFGKRDDVTQKFYDMFGKFEQEALARKAAENNNDKDPTDGIVPQSKH